ncbi:MAG: DNA repair protein RecN [Piscirickettsiaceae bacterium]|nr:MAG: DNA repair protein RecN [Piscirickettsiaceae bacterium]PCI68058.1 MAG: DNA repair protein RecN [Piscirickettsiaceae bacterium]
MLRSIDVKGLAVVDSLSLDLETGLTVLTGETGAGKSILLTAMKLCLGERADNGLVRPGADKADITLEFDIGQLSHVKDWLQKNDIDDEECLIRRTVSSDGRSRAFINGVAVNLKTLQSLSQSLVSIHGQHAHLDLLHSSKQCQLLDDSCPSSTTLDNCRTAYQHWKSLSDELLLLTDGNTDNDSEKQLLKYQIEELLHANVVDLTYNDIVSEHTRLSNMSKIIELGESQASALYENDAQSIHSQLSNAHQALSSLAELSDAFSDTADQINESLIQIQEACRDLRHKLDQQTADPEQLDFLDQQLAKVHELARKNHVEPQQLPEQLSALQRQLDNLENKDERLAYLSTEIDRAETEYHQIAGVLSALRTEQGQTLEKQITTTLKTLGLPDGHFTIQVEHEKQGKPQEKGLDSIRFLVTTNPGMPAKPINKVASGGELSRISLAIQVVATQANITPTLVFDEVDAGIGGGVAETVGIKLRELAQHRQILCVTHLPQVASQGQTHLYVKKSKANDQTAMVVESLNTKQRIDEIARMLGGVDISEKTLAHAQEMLEKAI